MITDAHLPINVSNPNRASGDLKVSPRTCASLSIHNKVEIPTRVFNSDGKSCLTSNLSQPDNGIMTP